MSSVKVLRGPVRTAFTRVLNELRTEIEKPELDEDLIRRLFKRLEGHRVKLLSLNDKIEGELLAAEGTPEQDFAKEYETTTEYEDLFSEIEARVQRGIIPKKEEDEASMSSRSGSDSGHNKSKYRLPKLEFKKYDGNPREWLSFWCQFKSIHDDEVMSPMEKFQYLIQATVEKS